MAVAIVAGLFGLIGTFVGAGLTTWTARQTADRSERRGREESRRQEFRSVVIRFASAVLDHRRAAGDVYNNTGSNPETRAAIGEEAYRTRAAMLSAFYELLLSTSDPEVVRHAELCVEEVSKIRPGESQAVADDSHQKTRSYLGEMISAARKAQPGWTFDVASAPSTSDV